MADYNINAITRRVVFSGSAGLGPYAFTFEILDENDIAVYFNATKLTITTDYTVTINANGTGSATIVTGGSVPSTPTASDSITIVGARDIERTTDFVTAGDLRAAALNEQLDGQIIMTQQLAEENKRSMQAPVTDPAHVDDGGTLNMTLPAKADRAGKYLAFNATTGNPEAGPDQTDVTALSAITSDIATLADIQDGTVATNAITTASSISSNITTVAGIASNVSTVAGISSDVTSVAADATDIGTVATNIASVNTVAGNITEVIAVANDLNEAVSEVETVANDLNEAVSEIETVAASISNVDAVGTNIANVNTVAGISSNVTTVAGISANVTTVAGISANVTTVAGISSDVTTVAADGTDIGTVATNISNVNTVAGISSNVTTVAGISANVTTVAGISSDVTAVAADATDIGTVATNLAGTDTIGTVATNIANVNSVGGSISNVNTVASNLSSINDFADKYRIGASDPTTDNDEGDLFYNTTSDTLKVYTGSAWEQGVTAGSGFLPTTGGSLTGDVSFGDNNKAIFGAGSDLQIYHDGSHSYIKDAGTGQLRILATDLRVNNTANDKSYITGTDGAEITLYHNGSGKLATTSGGIDVQGSVTADGLQIDNPQAASSPMARVGNATQNRGLWVGTASDGNMMLQAYRASDGDVSASYSLSLGSASNKALEVNNGDIAFYDSTGVTQGFFWDASTQRLGLGVTAPSAKLDVRSTTSLTIDMPITAYLGAPSNETPAAGSGAAIGFQGAYNGSISTVYAAISGEKANATSSNSEGVLRFGVRRSNPASNMEAMRINSSGSLLVAKTSDNLTDQGHVLGVNGYLYTTRSGNIAHILNRTTSDGIIVQYRRDNVSVGNISVTGSGTTYNTTSDIRLKTDIAPIADATDKLMAMNAVTHKWKADPDADAVVGFIAQEMAEIVPEAVSKGEGEDDMWSMDYGRITPVLVAALQDAVNEIKTLKERVAELEAK